MNESNPYQPPSVIVQDAEGAPEQGNFVPEGRAVSSERGLAWVTEGFRMAFAQFGPWLLITIILTVFYLVISLTGIGIVLNALLPVFMGGVLIGARRQAEGGTIEIGDLFAGFKEKFGPLVVVGILVLVLSVALTFIVLVPFVGVSMFSAMMTGNERAALGAIGALFLAIPLILLISMVVTACWWLAPALIVFHDIPPIEAMKRSFTATLRNWAPVLIYGVLASVAAFLGSLLLLIGLLVVVPALMAATYLAYRDIFIER